MNKKPVLEMFKDIKEIETADDPKITVEDLLPFFCEKVEQALLELKAIKEANSKILYGKREQRGGLQESLDTSLLITEEEFKELLKDYDNNGYDYYCYDERCNQILFLGDYRLKYQWLYIQLPYITDKSIKEAKPSEAMDCFKRVWNDINSHNNFRQDFKDLTIVKNYILKAQEQEKENEILKEIIKSFFDKGCPLHQYIDKDFGLAIEVDDECSTMILGEYKGVDLDKYLKGVLESE